MIESRPTLILYYFHNITVSWEECPNKDFLEQSWKRPTEQLSSIERKQEIIRLRKIIWQLEASLEKKIHKQKP